MKNSFLISVIAVLLVSGCAKDITDQPVPGKTPRTFLWLAPDSTIAQGPSKQHIKWWGEDPDGIVKGYLFASGKFYSSQGKPIIPPFTAWRWRTTTDTIVAFPLTVKRDTFQVTVRAVDNTFQENLPDQALIFLSPVVFWDVNEDSIYDAGDVLLPSLSGAMDPVGAALGIPVVNQPPTVVFAQNPNDPGSLMQQPDTTYTAATFAWVGTDPDGDKTIMRYEIALNNLNDSTRLYYVPGNVTMISIVVPRDRIANAAGEVDADVYIGTFLSKLKLPAVIKGLKPDTLNAFYIRARDVAGDTSRTIAMPDPGATPPKRWFVKNPKGKLLIVNDFVNNVSGTREVVLQAYLTAINGIAGDKFKQYEVLDIARGLTPQNKKDGKVGAMVPPYIDPAFLFTLQLFDVVFWYTDPWPSLAVAQFPLFQYTRDPSHRGRVIFSTMFESAIDPRAALRDFAPIDSISSVDVLTTDKTTGKRLLPEVGDTRIFGRTPLYADSSDLSNIYPNLKFNTDKDFHLLFMRPVYARADARYIYHLPEFQDAPKRYAYSATLSDLNSVSLAGSMAVACGSCGVILSTTNGGQAWTRGTSGTASSLNSVKFINASSGWAVGDSGTILQTDNGGTSWNNRSVLTFEDLLGVDFSSSSQGIAVGTSGIIIRTTDGSVNWASQPIKTRRTLRAVQLYDATSGILVGDTTIAKTTDGGISWEIKDAPPLLYTAVKYVDNSRIVAVSLDGVIVNSTDGGESWSRQASLAAGLRSVNFLDNMNGWVCGNLFDRNDPRGVLITTHDGGITWSWALTTSVTQHLTSVILADVSKGWCVGTGGLILYTSDAGLSWSTQPKGQINLGVIDGGKNFVFLGLPLHLLNGGDETTNIKSFFEYIFLHEFGL